MIVRRIFLCIGIVIWSLLIHFAPLGREPNIFEWIMFAFVPFALIGEVVELWRAQW